MPTCNATIPNLFIVGAARSGTTSLWQYLKQHPSIYMPEDELYKEPGFFAATGEHMGFENYMSIFPAKRDTFKFIGEASTAYLTDPSSAERLYHFNPDAKIIIILRNPADRAYSLYNWMVQDGYEYAPTFGDALALEHSRSGRQIPNWSEPQYYWNYMYLHSGLYSEQVKRYLDSFGDSVIILKFEDFKRNPANAVDQICSFLGLDKHYFDAVAHNPSRCAFSAKIQFLLRKLNDLYHSVGRQILSQGEKWPFDEYYRHLENQLESFTHLSIKDKIQSMYIMHRAKRFFRDKTNHMLEIETKEIRDSLLTLGLSNGKPHALARSVRTMLLSEYCSDIERLSSLTGMKFTEWLD